MSKPIYQHLIADEIFRSMWADSYSTSRHIIEHFKDEYNPEHLDDMFKNEVYCAINYLDSEMRELFLTMRYPSKD